MAFTPLHNGIVDLDRYSSVHVAGGCFQQEVTLDDIALMRSTAEEALSRRCPTVFVWDVRDTTRAGTPEVRLASLRLRTDLIPVLEAYEVGTIMVAPTQRVTSMLLRIIVKGMPRGSHIDVVDDLRAARLRLSALAAPFAAGQRQALSSP